MIVSPAGLRLPKDIQDNINALIFVAASVLITHNKLKYLQNGINTKFVSLLSLFFLDVLTSLGWI